MTQQTIDIGANPGDLGDGDPLRTGGIKINANFTELYAAKAALEADQHNHSNKTVLDNTTASYTTAEETKLAGIETGATGDQSAAEIKTAYESNANTNAYTDAEKTKLTGIETGATADQTAGEIKTAYESNADTNAFTDAEKTKLGTVTSGAEPNTVDSVNTFTGAVVLDADDISDTSTTNKFTTAGDISKLAGIESGATADQSAAEIKTAYESNADTNEFSDAEQTKLSGIETGADQTDATNVAAAGAVMDGDFTANGSMERTGAGAYTTIKHNRTATTDPTVNSDSGAGYVIGSEWVNTTSDEAFICVDNTSAAAVWKSVTQSAASDTSAIHVDEAGEIAGVTEKGTPVSTDMLIIEDSADSNSKKMIQVGNLPTAGGGEANTASNGGTGGVGITLTKSGIDLPFKSIAAGSGKITVTDDPTNKNVDIDLGVVASTDLSDSAQILHTSDIGTNVQAHSSVLDNTTASYTTAEETKLLNIEAGATADQTAAEIKTAYESNLDTNEFSDAEKTKLTGIEVGATADQTGAEIKTAYELEANTNAYTDGEKTKLAGIETGATADQTAGEIKTAYESNADTNAYTDAEVTKLAGIESGAEVTSTAKVDAAGATMNTDASLVGNSYFLDEDTMASNSDSKVPSQQSVKAYVDASGLDGAGTESITGLWTFINSGLGGLTNYDVNIGDTVTPDYGIMRVGKAVIGRTSHNTASLDLDGTVVVLNQDTPVTSNILFAMLDSTNSIRFALPKSAVGNATYNPRSMLCAGPAVADDTIVTVGYWQTQGIFHNLACDTSTDGADLGVQNDLEVEGDIFTDSIKESTTAAGVTIDGVLIKDGAIPTIKSCLVIAAGDETTALTVADDKVTFRMPYNYTLTDIRASVTTAPTGSSLIADVDLNGTSIMTTNKLEIEVSEKSTKTALTQPDLTTTALTDDDELQVNINQIGSTVAGAGLKVYLIGYPS